MTTPNRSVGRKRTRDRDSANLRSCGAFLDDTLETVCPQKTVRNERFCYQHRAECAESVSRYKTASERAKRLGDIVLSKFSSPMQIYTIADADTARAAVKQAEECLDELMSECEGRLEHTRKFFRDAPDEGHVKRVQYLMERIDICSEIHRRLCDRAHSLTAPSPQIRESARSRKLARRKQQATIMDAKPVYQLFCGAVFLDIDDESPGEDDDEYGVEDEYQDEERYDATDEDDYGDEYEDNYQGEDGRSSPTESLDSEFDCWKDRYTSLRGTFISLLTKALVRCVSS
ncbi:hypothetical protein C8Q74DRAFT_246563 [Fomes fomentarius]|nr:hypothetical protein C8Q74DRAFT_246563 [Fomes fomentarius]